MSSNQTERVSLVTSQRAAVIEPPRIFIRHGENRRNFIGPHAIELPNGDLLMSAPWGRPPADIAEEIVAGHPVPDLYRSTDRGRTWTKIGPLPVAWEHSGFVSDGGVSFLRLADGRLALLLHRHIRGLKGGGLPAICFSSDDGQTWTDPVLLADPADEGVWYVMNDRLLQTRSGRLIVPVARAVGNFEGDRDESLVFYSDDAGETWQQSGPAPLPDGPCGMAEPCVIELNDGRLLMLARGGLRVLLASRSSDGGCTWSRGTRTTLMSPLSSLTLRRLPDGRLIVFYNHAEPSEPGGAFPRCPLVYAVSADEGAIWSTPFIIDNEGLKPGSGELPDMAHVYPGITFLEEGMLVLYSSHMTHNRFGARSGDVPWTPEQLARTGGKTALLAYPSAELSYPPMLLKSAATPEDVDGESYDLVVIGGTPGGIACAVRAAREDLKVLLVHHTQHLGGFMTSGAGGWEAPYDGLRSPIYGEMLSNAAAYYRDTYGEGSQQHLASMPNQTSRRHLDRPKIEPRIAEMLFNRMVEEEDNLTVLLGHIVTTAEGDGALLRSVTLRPMHGRTRVTVHGKVFADGMVEGDLMAAAGVKTQIGRESRAQYGEEHAGVIYTKKRRREPGQRGFPRAADEGTLNIRYNPNSSVGIVEGPHSGEADGSVMAYNYRLILTRNPANRIMVRKPVNFDPAIAKAAGSGGFVPNLPNDKVAWNGGRLIGPQNDYPDGDWPTREAISKRYLDAMLMRLWWMQNDPDAPESLRRQFEGYGLAADEFPDNHHLPYEIYVREARRLVGRYVFREQDNVIAEGIARTPIHSDSIAITDWPMDSVACLPRQAPGSSMDGILFLGEESRPAQVPYRSLRPVELDNLLVPVAISASHVGFGSIRLEPVWMQLGESAGFAAALAVQNGTTPAALDPDLLIRKLAPSRVMISFFNDVDVTSDDPRVPAAQYFGTKGFFSSYDARLDEPLTEAVLTVWKAGLQQLHDGALDPMPLAERVHHAESQTSPATGQTRGDFLLGSFSRLAPSR